MKNDEPLLRSGLVQKATVCSQVMLYDDENKCMIVSRVGTVPELRALCIARTIPDGVRQFEFEFPYKQFKKIVLTSDNQYFIAYGYDKLKVGPGTRVVNH